MLETLDLDLSFEDFETATGGSPETESPLWEGLSSWLNESSDQVWE